MPTRLDRTQHLLLLIMALCSSWQTTNCLAVGTQSALLAGFAYSGLTQVAFPHDAPYFIKLLYMLATTTAMGFDNVITRGRGRMRTLPSGQGHGGSWKNSGSRVAILR